MKATAPSVRHTHTHTIVRVAVHCVPGAEIIERFPVHPENNKLLRLVSNNWNKRAVWLIPVNTNILRFYLVALSREYEYVNAQRPCSLMRRLVRLVDPWILQTPGPNNMRKRVSDENRVRSSSRHNHGLPITWTRSFVTGCFRRVRNYIYNVKKCVRLRNQNSTRRATIHHVLPRRRSPKRTRDIINIDSRILRVHRCTIRRLRIAIICTINLVCRQEKRTLQSRA